MTEDLLAPWHQLEAEMAGWCDDPAEAKALLDRLGALAPFRGNAAPRSLGLLRNFKGNPGRVISLFGEAGGSDEPLLIPAFRLHAATGGDGWPWSSTDTYSLVRRLFAASVDDGRTISRRSASLAVFLAPHAGGIEWLGKVVGFVQREHWIPSVAVIAATLAGPRATDLSALGLEEAARAPARDGGVYPRRHIVVLANIVAALTGKPFGGRDAAAWFKHVQNDVTDLSALAMACAETAAVFASPPSPLADLAELALDHALRERANDLGYQHVEAARRTIEVFGDRPAAWAMLLRPCKLPTLAEGARVGSLAEYFWDAYHMLQWVRERGDEARAEAMLRGPLADARSVLAASTVSAADWLPQLRAALALLTDAAWEGSPAIARAANLVAALVLVRAPLAAAVAWPRAVTAAGADWLAPSDGTTGARGWVDLVGLAATRGALFRYLLHQHVDGPRAEKETSRAKSGRTGDGDPRKGIDDAKTTDGGAGKTSGTPPRETAGLARLLRARWRRYPAKPSDGAAVSTTEHSLSEPVSWRVDPNLTRQCARHIVRRLVTADEGEAARVFLAALAADAPAEDARFVDVSAKDELWKRVEEELLPECRSAAIGKVLSGCVAQEGRRALEHLAAEAQTYHEATLHFATLQTVGGATQEVWKQLVEARATAPRPRASSSDTPDSAAEKHTWIVGAAPAAPATPEAVRRWIEKQVVPLARLFVKAAEAIEKVLAEKLPDHALRETDVKSATDAAGDELVASEIPVLEAGVVVRWRAASRALRRLAAPLPWHIEAGLDAMLVDLEGWIDTAQRNGRERSLLLERVEHAIKDQDEAQLQRVLDDARGSYAQGADGPKRFDLIDEPRLRGIGNFWLRRLRFDEANRVPRPARKSPWTYYGPLVLAILGAPLTTIQTNNLWEPLLNAGRGGGGDPALTTRYWIVNVLFLAVCSHGLWQDLRRRLAGVRTREILRRAGMPLGALIAINYLLSLLLWWVTAPEKGLLATTFLWGTLSMYLGLFIGLFAQGSRIDSEDVQE